MILPEANHDWVHLCYRIINPLKIIIRLFIRFVLNYDFMRKNLLIKIRLRKLSVHMEVYYASTYICKNPQRVLRSLFACS
jgi:hypothetical protein